MKNRILVIRHIRQAQCKLRTSQREAFSRLSGISNWDGFSLLRLQASWRELFRYRHHFIVLIFALLNQNFLVGFLGTPIPQGMPEVSVSQGKAGFSIPIDLPPGKMVPGLALSYNSASGNGLVGVGWELSGMEFIQRDPSFGINFNNGDTFSSSMGGRLVSVGGGNYQTFKESFVRYTPSGGCGASYCSWIATDKSGTKYHFGGTADSQIVAVGRAEIRVWALSKVVDLHGNQYSISYNSDGNGGYWPVSLNYANRTIVFGYAGRGDHSQDYSQGANSQLVYRLTSVSIQVNGSEIRRYDLTYQTGGTGKSRLKKVSKSGSNQWGTEAYDDLDFGYSDFNTSWILPGGTGIDLDLKFKSALVDSSPCGTGDAACLCTLSGPCMAGWSQAQSICAQYAFANIIYGYSQSQSDMCHTGVQNKIKSTFPVDIDGDGKTDFARLVGDEANNSIRIKVRRDLAGSNADADSGFNVPFHYNIFYSFADINGDGKTDFAFQDGNNKLAVAFGNGSAFNSPVAMNQISLDPRQTDISVWGGHKGNDLFGDIDGDGRADFVHFANNVHRVYLSTGNGFDGGRDIGFATPDKLENPQLVDMNGDGRADFVHIGNNDQIYVYSYNINTNAPSVQYGISDRGRSEYRWFVDVNGDGRPDFVRLIGKTIKVSLFTGNGFTGPYDSDFSAMSLDVNQLIDGDQATQARKIHFDFGDFNGDGKTDIVYNDTYQGRTSGEIHYSNGTGFYYVGGSAGSFSDDRFSHAADVNGDGRADRVSFYDTNGTVVARYSTVSASDLLTSITGSFGKTININYSLSGQVGGFNAGSGGYPDLPNVSPDFLVTSISENHGGGISENSAYAYSNNRFYSGTPDVREGLGFAWTRATNATTGFYQDTYFSQNKPYNGAVVRSVSYNPSGNRMSDTNIAYSNSAPFGTTFVFQTAVTEESLDNGNSLVIKSSSLSYDGFGNVDSTTESIGPRTTVINTTTNNDTTNWIIGRPTKITKAVNGTLVDDQRFTYTANDATFIQKLSGAGLAGTTINYDQFGNATSITNALGATTMMQYDGVVNKFVTQMTNAKGQTISSSYDTDLGVVTTSTDPMGIVTTKAYDAYGRVNSITSGAYNETYQYQFTGDPTQQFVEKRVTDDSSNGYIWTRGYQDALGRTVKNESEGINGNVITETFQFDPTTGRLMQKSNSYLAGMEGPLFYIYQYNDPDGKQTNITNPDGTFQTISYNGLSVTTTDQAGTTTTVVNDQDGVALSKTTNGLTTSYGYDNARRMNRITEPGGAVTMMNYNGAGQRVSQSDSNSGTTTYSYDQLGNLVSTTDARGVTINTSYDSLNRVAQVSGSSGESTIYSYDGSGAIGKLTSVTENLPGKTPSMEQYKYDSAGRLYESLRTIDDLAVIFRTKYDSMNRVSVVTYPDGTKLNHVYADSGHLTGITMDSADGTSVGHPVVSYQGPTANQSLIRQTGNGVKTEISYNPANLRPTAYTTTLADGSVNQNISYAYDLAGNITGITDNIYQNRTQTFAFDNLNRLTSATGVYGQETYAYQTNGNMITKGNTTLQYGDGNHVNAVTAANSQAGVINYSYDSAGNMVSRNGDAMSYDSFGRLNQIQTSDGKNILYTYTNGGDRIKKELPNNVVVYSFGGRYQVTRQPGQPDLHTVYVKGLKGDLVAQMTRNDAVLITSLDIKQPVLASNHPQPLLEKEGRLAVKRVKATFAYFVNTAVKQNPYQIRLYAIYGSLAMLVIGFIFYFIKYRTDIYLFSERPLMSFAAPFAIYAFIFVFGNCNGLLNNGKSGNQPWFLLPNGVTDTTPGVDDTGGSGSSGAAGSGLPVTGMYFLHPDHLGSITMITGASGKPITGAGGQSRITYSPYGSIDRPHSGGPDISKHKFTGQEEDSESGLMYYKARYYDAVIGAFTKPDALAQVGSPGGMNRFAYVSGNPVGFRDPSGAINVSHMFGQIIKGIKGEDGKNSWKGAAWAATLLSGGPNQATTNLRNNINNTVQQGKQIMSDFVQKPVQAILDFFKANPWAYAYLGHLDYLGKYNIGNFWKDAVGGYKWAAQGATGALKWASKGWDNAARTFNNATGLSKYGNGQDDWEKSDLGKWGKRAAFLSEERVEGLYAAYQIGGYIIVGVILGGSIIVALGLGFGIGFAILEGIVSVIAFLGPLGIVMVGAGFLCSRQPAGSCQYMSGG